MEELIQKITSLKLEVNRAIQSHGALKLEHEKLQNRLQQELVEKEAMRAEIRQQAEALKNLKLAQALTGTDDQDSRNLKQQVSVYLREIDKCLALLNRD